MIQDPSKEVRLIVYNTPAPPKYIKINKELYRPSEVRTLLGDCRKAKRELKWKPKYDFENLVKDMVDSDIDFVQKQGY